MVGEQHDLALLVGVPDHHAAQEMRAFGGRPDAGEADYQIGQDVAVLWWFAFLDHLVDGVLLHAGDEEDAVLGPSGEQAIIVVGPVHGDDGARCEADFPGRCDVVAPGFRDQYEGRHVIAMIEHHMDLDAARGAAEPGPGKQVQAQRHGRRIERQKLVPETKPGLAAAEPPVAPEPLQGCPEQVLVKRGGAVFVGIGQRRSLRSPCHAEMRQLAQATGKAAANLAQTIRPCQMAEQHGDELVPAGEALGVSFGAMLLDQERELRAWKMAKQLTE